MQKTGRFRLFSEETEQKIAGVWLGAAIAVGGSFHALVFIMFASYIEARTERSQLR